MDLSKIRGDYVKVRDSLIGKDRTILQPNQDTTDFTNTDRSDTSTIVYEAYKTIDTLAMYARDKADSVINQLMKLSVSELCDSNIKNDLYLKRLMNLNAKEKEITLNALGVDVQLNGDSRTITSSAQSPSYVQEYDYKENYVKNLSTNDGVGRTQSTVNNGVYKDVLNHYPDDDGTGKVTENGVIFEKWDASNQNSLLYKTKKLFEQNKVNTIISRFHTSINTPKSDLDVVTDKYGLSHGKNLLTKKAEESDSIENYNGYDDPYCRVWTHHHQYNRLDRLIRPFVTVDNKESKVTKLADFHNWYNFRMKNEGSEFDKERQTDWGWKYNNDAWKYSVLSDNGFINITPKFINGGKTNIHTKQCMFSIENLAWRDYDPYSFEKALSWEQRGPMGGRIMWFPPYGISFNETTSANWQNNTFIGRGEDVYSYVNTKRTGTLNFMLVVDHPSINDYVSFYEPNMDNVSDNDLLRFQAGCDESGSQSSEGQINNTREEIDNAINNYGINDTASNDGKYKVNKGGLTDYAEPTPLTDEYIEKGNEDEKEAILKEIPKEEDINPQSLITITFYVFYPNNYSGYYDNLEGSKVDPIAYLLFGKGAQMQPYKGITSDLQLKFDEISENIGNGYEMRGEGISVNENSSYIIGTDNTNWENEGNYIPNKDRKWFYRIDGKYDNIDSPKNSNCYNQILFKVGQDERQEINKNNDDNNYSDYKNFHYNCNIKDIINEQKNGIEDDEQHIFCSLSDFAIAISNDNIKDIIIGNELVIDNKKIKRIKEVINNYDIIRIESTGYSNSIGGNGSEKINNSRNNFLAEQRAQTPVNWIKKYYYNKNAKKFKCVGEDSIKTNVESSVKKGTEYKNNNGPNAKAWRSAKVVLTFNASETNSVNNTNQKPNIADIDTDEVLEGIKEKLEKWRFYSELEANLLDFNVNSICDSVLTEKYNGSENINKIKELFNEVELYKCFNTSITNVEFINKGFELFKNEIEKNISSHYSNEFLNAEDFANKLGNNIIENIKKEKCVLNVFNDIKKDYNEYTLIVEKYNNITKALEETETKLNEANEKKEKEGIKKAVYELIQKNIENNDKIDVNNKVIDETINTLIELYNKSLNTYNDNKSENNKKAFEHYKNDLLISNSKLLKTCINELNEISNEIKILSENKTKLNKLFYDLSKNNIIDKEYIAELYYNKVIENINILIPADDSYYDYSKDVIANFVKNQTNIGSEYINEIVDKLYNKDVINIDSVKIIIDENNEIVLKVILNDNNWENCNKILKEEKYNNENDASIDINNEKIINVLKDLTFYTYDEKYKNIEGFKDCTENDYGISSSKTIYCTKIYQWENVDYINNIVDIIKKANLVEYIEWKSVEELYYKLINSSLFIYDKVELNNKKEVITNKINKELEEYKTAIDNSEYVGFSKHTNEDGSIYYINENETRTEYKDRQWIYDEKTKQMVLKYIDGVENRSQYSNFTVKDGSKDGADRKNKIRYDQEYHFFRTLKQKDPIIFDKLMKKLQYFNPAYHSMTPEGFSARLTFLQQCTRQGDTSTATDRNVASANNLAFGRPPFCVLRLGDFYNQMIVIDNISINYDPLVWDLNTEGIGVIPLIANVSISFTFIGGSSMTGPVQRLQNAMTFNYYANSNLYDNRSDRPYYNWDNKTNGALNHSLDIENSYFHTVQTYKKNK